MFPLAPLCDDAPPILPDLIDRMTHRLLNEHRDHTEARTLAVATDLLLGLRYDREVTKLMMEKVMNLLDLKHSHGYQLILEEGKAEGILETLRATILRLGKKKFGEPTTEALNELMKTSDESRLTALSERVLDVDSWKDLLSPGR